jgi:hypothetical protein
MSDIQEANPVEVNSVGLLVKTSLLAHVLSVWISLAFILGAGIFMSVYLMLLSVVQILGVWLFLTLPLSAICIRLGIQTRYHFTLPLGAICGTAIGLGLASFGYSELWSSGSPVYFFAAHGAITAAVFSFISRKWGRPLTVG